LSERRSGVVPLLVISALFAVGLAALVLSRVEAPGPARGAPVPDFELTDLAGARVALSSLRGRVVFVNFWATWCPPCRDEAPSLERMYGRLHDEGFDVLAISVDASSDRGAVAEFQREFGLSFPVLLDPEQNVHAAFGVTGVPETYVIDTRGRLAERFIGPRNWDDPRYARAVRRLLAAGAPERADG
jgi:peroxiredoxin